MKTYEGRLAENGRGGRLVFVRKDGVLVGAPLNPRYDLRNHSPDGFMWGYSGSGPAQLALALCADVLQDDKRALKIYQRFKEQVVARLDQEASWELPEELILRNIELVEAA